MCCFFHPITVPMYCIYVSAYVHRDVESCSKVQVTVRPTYRHKSLQDKFIAITLLLSFSPADSIHNSSELPTCPLRSLSSISVQKLKTHYPFVIIWSFDTKTNKQMAVTILRFACLGVFSVMLKSLRT